VLDCGGERRDRGDADVGSRSCRRARGCDDDYREPNVAEDQTDETPGERRDEAPQCDRYQQQNVQPLEYPG
jgi:hypothetical protein